MSRSHTHNMQYNVTLPPMFQTIELESKDIVHNVADIIMVIPQGTRCLFWFTLYENQPTCFVIEAIYPNRRGKIYPIVASFDKSLCYGKGTLLRGTYVHYNKMQLGAVEDMYYYKGVQIQKQTLHNRLTALQNMFCYDISQTRYFTKHSVITMCILLHGNTTPGDVLTTINALPYKVKYAQYRFSNRDNSIVNVPTHCLTGKSNNVFYKQNNVNYRNIRVDIENLVFKVKPDIQNDLSSIHVWTGRRRYVYMDTLESKSYDTSVMLNKLFRKIKENANLDALEESDDEEEFEDVRVDKFVKLNASFKMVCEYVPKINKWIPQKLAW